ncbi:MAG TPA: preprotein translocase subunit SecG [Armatimonadaceae bacterium]|nr:preprotein translocase subunit SecG [Armatimonadaceae bacterium]
MGIVIGILTTFVVLTGLVLVVLVTMQTPRNEGFGGGVANVAGGNFRGKAGYDEMLSNYTRIVAIAWFVLAFVLAVVNEIVSRG